jgi:microcystin-dependent protein
MEAQVGIGTTDPDPNVILDIKSTNRGVLLPRLIDTSSTVKREGTLAYDTISGKFKYVYKNKWLSVNPLSTDEKGNVTAVYNETIQGNETINGNTTINGTSLSIPNATSVTASNATVTANNFVGDGTIPIGGIIMWSGSPSNIPSGWALCNGQTVSLHVTPNLSGRFIVGYNAGSSATPVIANNKQENYAAIGNTGGETTHTLTSAESGLPAHIHTISDPGHTHGYKDSYVPEEGTRYDNGSYRPIGWNAIDSSKVTVKSPTGITINNNTAANASTSHENRPPYYVLAFIMRVR